MGSKNDLTRRETVRGERVAWILRWIYLVMVLAMAAVLYFGQKRQVGLYGMFLSGACLLYNAGVSWFVLNRRSYPWIRYLSVSIDIACLTIYNTLDSVFVSPIAPISSATLLIYPVIIFVASLRLDRILIVYATFASALAMNLLFAWNYARIDPSLIPIVVSSDILGQIYRTFYLITGGLLMLSIPATIERLLGMQKILRDSIRDTSELARTDKLTGLANRRHLDASLTRELERALGGVSGSGCGIFFLDLDGFKPVNDSYGHDVGDLVLVEVARRLLGIFRETDVVARIGGDEFVILATRVVAKEGLELLAGRILAAIQRPIEVAGAHVIVSTSIGISRFPEQGRTAQELIHAADQAMYSAKKAGKNRWVFAGSPDVNRGD